MHRGLLGRTLGLLHITGAVTILGWMASIFGILGTIASAYIYLVPARPSWNMSHTPLDFLLSAFFMGIVLAPVLEKAAALLGHLAPHYFAHTPVHYAAWPAALITLLWLANQIIRLLRLRRSSMFEGRASFALMSGALQRHTVISSLALAVLAAGVVILNAWTLGLLCAVVAILCARYLFFVSVVPLSMGLSFLRERHA